MNYSKKTDNKLAFTNQIFKRFTDATGGSAEEFADKLYARYTVEDFAFADDSYYWGVFGYFEKVVIPHKIAVYQAGVELAWQQWFKDLRIEKDVFLENLWLHDLSKFSANESFGYACYNRETGSGKEGFESAWHHHKMNNPHHPEYWLNPNRSGELEVMPMHDIYLVEMIADWIGAGKTYGSTLEEWLPKNIGKFKFHHFTAKKLQDILLKMNIDVDMTTSQYPSGP